MSDFITYLLHISLAQPYFLLLLPLSWVWYVWRRQHRGSWPQLLPVLSIRYPALADLNKQTISMTQHSSSAPSERLILLAMMLLIAALSQPVHQRTIIHTRAQSEPVDLILLVGTALSMTLTDYMINGQPMDRLSMARRQLDTFIRDYSGQHLALVIMGNPPALWLPFTTDKEIVRDAVARIRTSLGGRITDMGASLQLVRHSFAQKQQKIVVMISDGGTQIGSHSPQEVAQKMAAEGFILYVIAVGSDKPDAGLPTSASLIYEAVNLTMLQQVAQAGKGRLYHAQDAQAFTRALAEIEEKHRKKISDKMQKYLNDALYPFPLALAMLILFWLAVRSTGVLPMKHQQDKST